MARHSGKNGIVKHGANVIDGLRNWSLDTSMGTANTTAAGDSWATHDTTHASWSGSSEHVLDHAVAANHNIVVGSSVVVQFYSEGDASTKTFYEGTATVTGVNRSSPYEGEVTLSLTYEGNGELTTETVV